MATPNDAARPSKAKHDETRKMLSCQYNGKRNVIVKDCPVPLVTDQSDAIIRVTGTTVCGSDLHLYHKEIPALKKGDILGHEAVGVVDEVGSLVKNFKKGDRAVVSAVISCGVCGYCKRGEWSCCDVSNTSAAEESLYGNRQGALFGYSHLTGGFDGCQAEYVRVPYADVNLFHIPENVDDMKALLVADIACTGYHGADLANVQTGDTVAVFGCGPVGLMTQMWAKHRGASIVVALDVDEQRLEFAKSAFAHHVVNPSKMDSIEAVKRIIPGGPDKVIDCVGFRFPDSLLHKVERMLMLETDSPNIVNTAIKMVRKNGTITLIGDYLGYTNHFNIGAFMEKHLTMNGGQLWPHKDQEKILHLMSIGDVDPSVVITHCFPLSKIAEVYKQFDEHTGGIIKAFIVPDSIWETNRPVIKPKTGDIKDELSQSSL